MAAGSKRRTNGQGYAPEKIGPRPATKDHLKSKLAFRVWHPVVIDNEMSVALDAARKAYDNAKITFEAARARHLNYPANKEAQAEYEDATAALAEAIESHEEAREAAAEVTVHVRLKAPPFYQIEEVWRRYPPTDEDKAEWAKIENFPEDKWPTHSPTGVMPGLIAISMDEPKMTEEEVREGIWENDDWNEQEKSALYQAALSTQGVATVSLGKVSGPIRSDASNKASSIDTPSPAQSGTDE